MSNWPSIDHSLLSPSGRVSKRARKAAMDCETARLFPPGYWDAPVKSETERCADDVKRLRLSAQNLRELAARGMHTRKYTKEAARLEAEAKKGEGELMANSVTHTTFKERLHIIDDNSGSVRIYIGEQDWNDTLLSFNDLVELGYLLVKLGGGDA